MPRTVYSLPLLAAVMAVGSPVSAVVPNGFTWVVRDISGTWACPTSGVGEIIFEADGITFLQYWVPPGHQDGFHWEGRVVIAGLSTLTVATAGDAGFTAQFRLSGYELSLP
jgi:hypothetical protein